MHPGPALFMPIYGGTHICTNGPTWSAVVSPTSDQWSGLAYYNGTWVATGRGQSGVTPSNSIYSTNAGQSWTAGGTIPNTSGNAPFSLRTGAHNGWMVAFGNNVTGIVTKDQGLTWSLFTTGFNSFCQSVESGNGLFVFLSSTAAFSYSSPTGLTTVANATPAKLGRCWWNPNRSLWLGFENGGTRSWTSPDLVTWTAGPTMPYDSSQIPVYGISQSGSNIVIVYNGATSQNGAYSLDDGVTFSACAAFPGGAEQSYSVVHGNGIVLCTIALGGALMVSRDKGATWSAANSNTATKTWILGYDGTNGWLAAGTSGSDDTILNVGLC
jgi:hypothetical protein